MSQTTTTPEFIKKDLPATKVFDGWLEFINYLEKTVEEYGDHSHITSLNLGYSLFPLIDTIAYTLFDKSGRCYLRKLGVKHSYLLYTMFRNGQLHNSHAYEMQYKNGTVSWSISSSGGSSGFTPKYWPGYGESTDPDHTPKEEVFTYEQRSPKNASAHLSLDRLAALLRHDLTERKANFKEKNIGLIVGLKIDENWPTPDSTPTTE